MSGLYVRKKKSVTSPEELGGTIGLQHRISNLIIITGTAERIHLTGDIVPPARITDLAESNTSRKWVDGFSC